MTELTPTSAHPGPVADSPFWLLAVAGINSGSTALAVIQPATQASHDAVTARFKRAGYGRISRREWESAAWPLSPTSAVDVVRHDLVRVTTGAASIYTAQPTPVTPMWTSAARERRALVGVMPVDTFASDEIARTGIEEGMARLADLASKRLLLGAMVAVRFDMPVRRPGGQASRVV